MTELTIEMHDRIIALISIALRVSRDEMLEAHKKDRRRAEARFIAYKEIRERTDLTLDEIGTLFNKRSPHFAVIWGIGMYEKLITCDEPFRAKVARCEFLLAG